MTARSITAVIQFARLSGFSPIIATASLHNAEYLKSLGATHVIDRTLPTDTVRAKAEDLAGGPFDLVYDAVSTSDTMPLAYALTSPSGDMVVVSPPSNLARDEEPKKKVHMARGLLALPGNEDIGASLLGALPVLLEAGEIKVRHALALPPHTDTQSHIFSPTGPKCSPED